MSRRSQEVSDILGTPPGWLLRYGMLVVLLGCVLLFVVASFFHYPDIIKERVVLSTTEPPVPVYAPGSGYVLRILKNEGDTVRAGDILITLDGQAVYEHVQYLEAELDQLRLAGAAELAAYRPDRTLKLGAIQSEYDELRTAIDGFQKMRSSAGSNQQAARGALNERRSEIRTVIAKLEAEIAEQNRTIALKKREVDLAKKLYQDGDLSLMELNTTKQAYQLAVEQRRQKETAISSQNEALASLRVDRVNIAAGSSQGSVAGVNEIQTKVLDVQRAIENWKQRQLVRAPASGTATYYTDLLPANTSLQKGEEFMAIIPLQDELEIVGRLRLPNDRSGKVAVGQPVRIKLLDYPFREYGFLWGQVSARSKVPKEREFYIAVELTDGMRTTLGQEIPFQYQMVGTAEIITEDKQFLERVLEEVWGFFRQFGRAS